MFKPTGGPIPAGRVLESIEELILCKSKQTQKAYHKALDLFAEFARVKRDSYAFERAVVEFPALDGMRFLVWLRARGSEQTGEALSDNTVAHRVVILRRIFRHLVDIGARAGNPFATLKDAIPTRQRVQKRPTKLIPFDLVPKILDCPERYTREGIRDRAILALLFGGGLRRNEVVKLNMSDIGQTPQGVPFLILRATKAGQNQEQSLPAWAWVEIERHLQQRDADGAAPGSPVFCSYYADGVPRGRLSDSTIVRLYRRYTAAVGISGAACHSARATAATALKTQGYEDRDVARFLRHSTETMVRVYDKRARGPGKNPGRFISYSTVDEDEISAQN